MNLQELDIDYGHWHQIFSLTTCTPFDHPEYIMPFGQKIEKRSTTDSSQFYCLNRGDKNPFLITNRGSNETEADSKTWTQWLDTPCPIITNRGRRCLGSRPDICVDPFCKYILIKQYDTHVNANQT